MWHQCWCQQQPRRHQSGRSARGREIVWLIYLCLELLMFSLNYPLASVNPSEKLAPVPGPRQFIVLTEIKFAVMFRIIIIISYQAQSPGLSQHSKAASRQAAMRIKTLFWRQNVKLSPERHCVLWRSFMTITGYRRYIQAYRP